MDFRHDGYFRLRDDYAKPKTLPQRLPHIFLVDGWAAIAYDTYPKHIDRVTKWHLQTTLHDENFHVAFGRTMAEKYVTPERDRDLLQREQEKIGKILNEVTEGLLCVDV